MGAYKLNRELRSTSGGTLGIWPGPWAWMVQGGRYLAKRTVSGGDGDYNKP